MDDPELGMLADTLHKTMSAAAADGAPNVEEALAELGWLEMLDEIPERRRLWCFGCWVRPGLTPGCSMTWCCTPPAGPAAVRCRFRSPVAGG